MDQGIPSFGEKQPGVAYLNRPGVYAVVRDAQQRIAVVRIGDAYYLPGGGVERDETPAQTLAREGLEECGCALQPLREIGHAIQYVTTSRGRHVAKRCHYYHAAFAPGAWCEPSETDSEFCWLTEPEALTHVTLAADRWALEQARRVRSLP
jgi:8-oxo-dGTP diphosphatase